MAQVRSTLSRTPWPGGTTYIIAIPFAPITPYLFKTSYSAGPTSSRLASGLHKSGAIGPLSPLAESYPLYDGLGLRASVCHSN